jgi:SOS-response transcriptional repressor LexA
MNKYERLKEELETNKTGKMKCFGQSMKPIIESGAMITFVKQDEYEIGDIVFCKVKGRYIDAHKITKKDAEGRFMISNNHGFDNGWTKTIFGRAVEAEYPTKKKKL